MDPHSPIPITTVRRNPPRRAKQTPSINALDFSTSSAVAAAGGVSENLNVVVGGGASESLKVVVGGSGSDSLKDVVGGGSLENIKVVVGGSENIKVVVGGGGLENLKVFIRIRPLEIRPKPAKNPKSKPRGKPQAQDPKGSTSNNVCLVVNNSSSVTLSPPPSVFDGKRTKSELYDGFSYVFPQESAQEDIYVRVMSPLVMDFLGGKSSLLAAMGPTGSGKTHTMFGSAREPGMVPLALRQIFSHEMENANHHLSRSYYLSMFEIYSERGKGERIFDLSPDGGDLSFQQSTIKGLQEIRVSDANEAESLVARGLLKRATAATGANSQSSRSQCIINIRYTLENVGNCNDPSTHGAVLTIADLAGAERERKTGNQGARLLESNFINNTSMVFGLCLKSLLEHQKNPKKSFEKHFKNSLLTRYLRDYLEGKKRMALILTVRPGEHDYLDTSFLLRQASPYMKIKFKNVEDVPSLHRLKRNTTLSFGKEDHKRRKFSNSKAEVVDGEKSPDVPGGLDKDVYSLELREIEAPHSSSMPSKSPETVHVVAKLNEDLQVELARMKRIDEVTGKFSKALWSVLKQYKDKLEESENEVRSLKEALGKQIHQVVELTNELMELRSHCSCYEHPSIRQTCRPKGDALSPNSISKLAISSPVDFKSTDVEPVCNLTRSFICWNPEISSVLVNESAVAGLKGILFDADVAGDCKSEFRNVVGRWSFVLERQKILASDAVRSSLPSGGFEGQNHHQTAGGLLEEEQFHKHLDSQSNSSVKDPSELDSAETAYEDVPSCSELDNTAKDCSSVGEHTPSKEDEKLETSEIAGSTSNVEEFNGPRREHTRFKLEGSAGNDNRREDSVEMEFHRDMEISCNGCSQEIEHSDVFATSNQMTNGTSNISSSDGNDTLLFVKVEASNTACSILSVENIRNQSYEMAKPIYLGKETLQDSQNTPDDVEGIKDGQTESLQDASLTDKDQDGRVLIHQWKSKMEVMKVISQQPELDASLVEDVKKNDGSHVREHEKNGKLVSSTKTSNADKPKRKLLPASTLLLKEFNSLDMEAENAKEHSKLTEGRSGRSQGSMSLVRLLTSKQ